MIQARNRMALRGVLWKWKEYTKQSFIDNIAAGEGVTCTASGVGGNDIAYSPNKVLDGDRNTYWTIDDKTEATLEVSLGETKPFDGV